MSLGEKLQSFGLRNQGNFPFFYLLDPETTDHIHHPPLLGINSAITPGGCAHPPFW